MAGDGPRRRIACSRSRSRSRANPGQRPSRRPGPRATALITLAACLAVTGYACAQAGIDGVAAIRGMVGGHRQPPSNGVVSGIKSLVSSPAFAAAMSKAASAAAASGATRAPSVRDWEHCPPAAAACADLTERVPWPRQDGVAGYGPVLPSPARG